MQDGKQQMLFVHFSCSLYPGFQHGELQDIARLLVEHQVRGDRHAYLVLTHTLLQFCLHRLKVQVQSAEQVDDGAFLASEHAQQQVFRPYRTAGQARSLLP